MMNRSPKKTYSENYDRSGRQFEISFQTNQTNWSKSGKYNNYTYHIKILFSNFVIAISAHSN